jgi:hypothetical protein
MQITDTLPEHWSYVTQRVNTTEGQDAGMLRRAAEIRDQGSWYSPFKHNCGHVTEDIFRAGGQNVNTNIVTGLAPINGPLPAR